MFEDLILVGVLTTCLGFATVKLGGGDNSSIRSLPSMAPACLKKTKKRNRKLVVIVHAPKAPSTRRRRQRKLEKQNLQLCDFPADLVANIVEGLSSADRIRFGATCKSNLSLVTTKNHHQHQYQFREIDKLPWLATFTCDAPAPAMTNLSLDFSLFEPLHVQGQPNYATYSIKDPNGEGFGGWTKNKLKASNKGWLLCVWPKQQGKETGHLTSFLLCSPFKKRIIKLPDLDHSFENNFRDQVSCRATFSSDPSSPDCVYFFLSQRSIPGKWRLSILDHQTSKEWKNTVSDQIIKYVSSVVYHEGCFYCVSDIGQLAAYDVVHQSWKSIIRSSPISYLGSRKSNVLGRIVVCEGKIILVVVDREPFNYKAEMNSFALFEFSCSTQKWVKITSLGNHALFLGESSFSVRVSAPSSPVNIADRAYFYSYSYDDNHKCNLFYYSFKDGQCHAAKGSGYWSTDVQRGIWVEPPCLTSSPSGFA